MRLVILESPFAGETQAIRDRNIAYARQCVKDCLDRGESPYASHLLLTQQGILDDSNMEERTLGILAGMAWISKAEASVVYYDRGISGGMKQGISAAKDRGIPVEYRRLRTPEVVPGYTMTAVGITVKTLAGWNNRCSVRTKGGGEYTIANAYAEDLEAVPFPIDIRPLSERHAIVSDIRVKTQAKWPFCPHELLPLDQRAEIEAKEAEDLASGAMTLSMCSMDLNGSKDEILISGHKIEAKEHPLRGPDGEPLKFTLGETINIRGIR